MGTAVPWSGAAAIATVPTARAPVSLAATGIVTARFSSVVATSLTAAGGEALTAMLTMATFDTADPFATVYVMASVPEKLNAGV